MAAVWLGRYWKKKLSFALTSMSAILRACHNRFSQPFLLGLRGDFSKFQPPFCCEGTRRSKVTSWRCRSHYRETQGRCFLFGTITGFEWVKSEKESVILDIRGRVVGSKQEPSVPGTGSLRIGNKSVEVRDDGTLRIEAATKEAK